MAKNEIIFWSKGLLLVVVTDKICLKFIRFR